MAKYEKVLQEEQNTLRTTESSSIKNLKIPTYLLEANGITKLQLDSVVLMFSLFNCFFVVFYLSFECHIMFEGPMKACGICADLAFIADIYLSLSTTYYDKETGDEVISPSKIFFHSLPGLILLDLPAGVPIFFIDDPCSYLNTGVILIRLFKLLGIFSFVTRLMYLKLPRFVRFLIKFLEIILWLSIYIHLMACLWNYIVHLNEEWQPFTLIEPGSDFFHLSLPYQYALCIYTIVASICRFEMLPSHKIEYIFLAASVIIGMLFSSILYGNIIVILQNLSKSSQNFISEHEKISRIIKNLQLPPALKKQVKTFFIKSFSIVDQQQSYQKLLTMLQPSIRKKINSSIFNDLFTKNKIFENKTKLISHLIQLLDHKFSQPDELIIKQFDSTKDIYFVNSGKVQVEVLDHLKVPHTVKVLDIGHYFGEISFLFNTDRTASVRSLDYSTCAVIPSDKLSNLFTKFPSFRVLLLNAVSKYKDPYRIFIEKTLAKVRYLQGLDSNNFNKLVYSLPVYSCPADSELFAAGQDCNSVFLVLEGSVKILFEVHGPSLFTQLKKKTVKMNVKDANRIKAANLVIDELGQGSVIGSNLMVLQQKFVITGRCSAQTRVMVLNRQHLDELIAKFPVVKASVEESVKMMKEFDPVLMAMTQRSIPLDYHKCRKYQMVKSSKLRTKFKSAVIEKILSFREWKKVRNPGMKVVIRKLKALLFLENKNRPDLEFSITRGIIPPEVAYAHNLISPQELTPLIGQFASMAKQTGSLSSLFQQKLQSLKQDLTELKQSSESSLALSSTLTKLYNEIENHLKH